MGSETYSFLRLRELIDAKIDRRLSLLAEVSSIDAELAEAHALLGDVPSLSAEAKTLVAAAPVAFVSVSDVAPKPKKKYPPKLIAKPCQRCDGIFDLRPTQKYCNPCFRAQAGERMTKARKARVGGPQHQRLVDEVDARLASTAVGYSNGF